MAFVSLDGFISVASSALAQGATQLPIADATICSRLTAGDFTLLRVGDGTFFETVRVTSCVGGLLTLAAPLVNAYPQGSCVMFAMTTAVVCEIVRGGGCAAAAPPPAACAKPSFIAGVPLPDFEIGLVANHAIAWNGQAPFTVNTLVKPSWMTVTVTGNVALLSGTPPNDSEINLQVLVSNDCGSTEINTKVCYCEGAGV